MTTKVDPALGEDSYANAVQLAMPVSLNLVVGYYADILFTEFNESVSFLFKFLLNSVYENEGKLEVVSRGSMDSLAIIVTDVQTLPMIA